MSNNFLTLLPPEYVRAYIKRYRRRLVVVALSSLLVLILAQLALLVPSYLYARVAIDVRERELEDLSKNATSPEEQEVDARLKSLLTDTAYLSRLSDAPSVADASRALLAVSRPGIVITGITFASKTTKEPEKMTLSGTAQTRSLLRQYVAAMAEVKGVQNAEVPISTYAQEADIRFVITLTGMPQL